MTELRLFLPPCAAAAAAACSSAPPAPPPVHVSWRMAGGECAMLVEGRPMTADQLGSAARAWRERPVRLDMDANTPYQCVGGAVFALQRAGVKRIAFVAEPPGAKGK